MRRNLPGDDNHRDGVHQCIGDAGDRIGRARARGDEDDTRLAGRAGIAFGGMGGGLFMADEDVADALLLEQSVINRQHSAAGIAKNDLNPEIA